MCTGRLLGGAEGALVFLHSPPYPPFRDDPAALVTNHDQIHSSFLHSLSASGKPEILLVLGTPDRNCASTSLCSYQTALRYEPRTPPGSQSTKRHKRHCRLKYEGIVWQSLTLCTILTHWLPRSPVDVRDSTTVKNGKHSIGVRNITDLFT